jgi:polyisoprenyl-phosphate glycosyltransferase
MSADKRAGVISVVAPSFNEEGNVRKLAERLGEVLAGREWEVIFVDDGSSDGTAEQLRQLAATDTHLRYISFSRNFGHQQALRAGLAHAVGDCVISMDADLQHPPELIPEMLARWAEGYEVVQTVRRRDESLSWAKRVTSSWFYRLMSVLSNVEIEEGAADFRLLDRAVVDVLRNIPESALFLRGMVVWVGFRRCLLPYTPGERFAGDTKFSFRKMVSLALDGITSFSVKPLYISALLGGCIATLAFIYGVFAISAYFFGRTDPGWGSLIASILFVGGLQLLTLGIMGEYLGKLFIESKRRPHYIIRDTNISEAGPKPDANVGGRTPV